MLNQGQRARLQNRVDEFKCVLYQDTFWSYELPGSKPERSSTVELLKTTGAITSIERVRANETDYEGPGSEYGSTVNRWGWVKHQEMLQEYLEERDELPCGHRGHIPPKQDGNTYYCKFCGAGHSRQQIKEVL